MKYEIRKNKKQLTLIGAGPGDPDLLTIKGVNALAKADVILYDALVNPEILNYARPSIEKIFVGKRANKHTFQQEEINQLIVEKAFEKGHVVRLKGGDPFIFGRGYEEKEHAESFGINVEVIPGISSSTGLTALQGIPLTKRHINESFWVVTGTTSSGKLSADIELVAKSSATAVILMGTKKLSEIVEIFSRNNKKNTPVAIIQNGSLPNEKVVTGKVKNIARIAQEEKIGAPAIIVIGEVVGLHKNFNHSNLVEQGVIESLAPIHQS